MQTKIYQTMMAVAVLLLLQISASAQLPSYIPSSSLRVFYPLFNNATDYGSSAYSGTSSRPPSYDGTSAYFNGYSTNPTYLDIPFGGISGDISVSVWVNPVNPQFDHAAIISKWGSNNSGIIIELESPDSRGNNTNVRADIGNGSTYGTLHGYSVVDQYSGWKHICVTLSGSTATLYINGIAEATINNMPAYATSGADAHIGYDPAYLTTGSSRSYGGYIKKLGVWARALSSCEAKALYLDGPTVSGSVSAFVGDTKTYTVPSYTGYSGGWWESGASVTSISGSNTTAYTAKFNAPGTAVFNYAYTFGSCTITATPRSVVVAPSTTGIEEMVTDGNMALYPNPTSGILNIETNTDLLNKEYHIYDITGREMMTGKIETEKTTLNVGALSTGIYLLQVGEVKQRFSVSK